MSVDDDFVPNGNGDPLGDLEEEFPLGDGTVDTEATVVCPYCAEDILAEAPELRAGPVFHRGRAGSLLRSIEEFEAEVLLHLQAGVVAHHRDPVIERRQQCCRD